MAYDNDANPLATTFLDYLMPSAPEMPELRVRPHGTMSHSLGGYKGMGEGGAIASPPAVANAINDALAQRGAPALTSFPFGPTQIMEALGALTS